MPVPGFVVEIVSREVVTKGGGCCLRGDDLAAPGAFLTGGQARFRASGWNSGNGCNVMRCVKGEPVFCCVSFCGTFASPVDGEVV